MNRIGIDLGGTNITAGIIDEEGVILKKKSLPTLNERESSLIINDISKLCRELFEEFNDIVSIGIGSPGEINDVDGIVIYNCNLGFENVDLREALSEFSVPVFVENDANCAAYGEHMFGAAREYEDSVTITLGTGVGSGVIKNGSIFKGSFYGGTEIGHMVINADGEYCNCGRIGCFEAYSSATAVIREGKKVSTDSEICRIVNGDFSKINAKIVFDAAEMGDKEAVCIIKAYYKNLAVGLANVINIFQPEIIVIGGGVSAQGEKLINPVKSIVDCMVYGGRNKTELVQAKLGNDAGLIGAALLK